VIREAGIFHIITISGAMLGTIFYDIATGSRVGTERALIMTCVMLSAVIFDRRSLTMRNLAIGP
jgi:competence protein ComEC